MRLFILVAKLDKNETMELAHMSKCTHHEDIPHTTKLGINNYTRLYSECTQRGGDYR